MGSIEIKDLNEEMTITEAEMKHVNGGIGLLLPAVQKVRESTTNVRGHEKWIEIESVGY